MITPIVLPWPLQSSLEAMARVLLEPGDRSSIDFSRPVGEAALVSPDSVSWRVLGTHDFPSGSDPAAAQDRACRYGDNLRRSQHGRVHDSPHSTNA